MKSVHNPDTYQQTYQDRLSRVRQSIEKRLQHKKQCFDPATFFNWLGVLDICTPEDKPEVEAELKQISDGVPQETIDAAWAWYAINMAAEYDTDGDTIIMAYQCLMGETEGAKQARRRKGHTDWHIRPLIEMCRTIRKRYRYRINDSEIYKHLPKMRCATGIESIEWWWKDAEADTEGVVYDENQMDEECVTYYLRITCLDKEPIFKTAKQITDFVGNHKKKIK